MTSVSPPSSIWQALTGNDPESTSPWLRWHPANLDACVEARGEAMPAPLDSQELGDLRLAHERWGADAASLEALERLGRTQSRVVVAGQQPGLLGGPLYTIYKALGAVKLAAELRERHPALDFVPVFWVASEDHDYEEVCGVSWPQAGGELSEFRFEHPDWTAGRMVGTLPAEPVLEPLIHAILEGTHETEFREGVVERLRVFGKDANWEDLFCRLLLHLTRKTGLVLISPLMPWVRRRAVAILRQEIASSGESTRIILERTKHVEASGLGTPLHRNEDAVNFFHVDAASRRLPVRFNGTELTCPEDESVVGSRDEWLKRLEENPECFSTNVVTRPLVQDSILPTVAQLVGPGEAAYFTQVESVYAAFGVFAPVRYPRPRALLVERGVERTLAKHQLDALRVAENDVKTLLHSIQVAAGDGGFAEHLASLRKRHRDEVSDLKKRLTRGGAADAAVDKLVQSMEKGYEAVAQRFLDDRRRQEPQLEAALQKLRANLAPKGTPQERVLNPIVPFEIKYGPGWIERLHEQLSVAKDQGVQVLTPGS